MSKPEICANQTLDRPSERQTVGQTVGKTNGQTFKKIFEPTNIMAYRNEFKVKINFLVFLKKIFSQEQFQSNKECFS